ncbi:hypothetical protein C8J56DRAFT_889555 [Mycena floridula]|nr:hypothetical protein C8J56DRAFT_891848 [Mycena floridula]KAJ7588792.1 hypothetical protein C8J56DRAFT_889555 [Mycena floridula]
MLSAKFILAVLTTFVVVSAAPGAEPLCLRSGQASATITVCSGSISPAQGCVTVPVVSASCINLTGGLTFLDKEISSASVPAGFLTISRDFGCLNGGVNHHDVAVLTGGTWNLAKVQGIAGTQNFNDLTSSFSCSPV